MRLKKKNNNKIIIVSARFSEREFNRLKIKAGLYTESNISEWIVFSAINHKPHKNDLE